MKSKLLKLIPAFSAIFLMLGCSQNGVGSETPDVDTDAQVSMDDEDGPYPDGVDVVEFKDDLGGDKYCSGFIATVDFAKNPDLRFNVSYNVPKKTPSKIYESFKSDTEEPVIVINGGYFAGTISVSLALMNGSAKCNNSQAINWPSDESPQCTVYPVRSAFGKMSDGSFQIRWIYGDASRRQTAYPSALGNNEKTKTFMAEPPTAAAYYGVSWTPQEAIGGGPRIVQNGKDVAVENYWAEVFDSGGTAGLSRQPRTGIGYTEDGQLIIIVCDGRGMNGSSGFTLSELAGKFISLGAVDAMNLDGGGSSAIVGEGGQVLNRPSDSGTGDGIIERPIVTAVVISEVKN